MRSRTAGVVLVTVTIVALLSVVVVAMLATGDDPAPRLAMVPPPSSPTSSPGPLRPSPLGTPAATGRLVGNGGPAPSGHAVPSHGRHASPTDGPSTCVRRQLETHLTIVTFNIHSARAQNGSVHLAEIAHALGAWHPDIVLLQEVDRGRAWTGRVDMPAVLAARLHMTWTFGINVRRSATNEYGTAILSRYPILGPRNAALPDPAGTQQRGLLHATIDVDGILLSVYGTHLESTSARARLQQIRTIEPVLAADPRPEIFGGDLNSTPDSPVVADARTLLHDTWGSVGHGPGATVPARTPHRRIDYLFYRDGSGVVIRPLGAQVLPRVVSDHRAVRATYQLSTGHGTVCLPVLSTGRAG